MDYHFIKLEIKDSCAVLTLNQPEKRNPLSSQVIDELTHAINYIQYDEVIRSVILTGTGTTFCSGGNLNDFPELNAVLGRRYMQKGHELLKKLVNIEKPVIAAVNGYAVGAGCNLALACDFVIASNQATFTQIFSKIGLVPDFGGMYFLPRLVGVQRAKELMFSGRNVTSQEALDIGMILEVVEHNQLMIRAESFANQFAESATVAIGMMKQTLNHSYEMTFDQVLNDEAFAQGISFSSNDFKERFQAMSNKKNSKI
ncbi:enoyl-CoA hydratase/isomerase family protein [Bacillus solimangrovi]|uniref:Enoyl-CoA hydratase n=1 Tax=Bacillus solimangrovi TaxID=1305675 RepID=A0A1E5LCN0_9BACI|nr:enoyl-CoA hydratase/isomerase family protein [Bacillus solimangrovi]OEH91835.1 hypothetical protein BFG57_03605 [Bacillus solimangrovi]